jgi:MFS family permease
MYLDAPLVMGLLRLFPALGRWAPIFGLLVMCISLAMSSLSTTVTHLIVAQGVFYAVGGSIAYSPSLLYMDEWFVKRKGLAYGIMWSGTGLAGVVLPLLLEYLLTTYGFQTTLRLWSAVLFVMAVPLALFVKPRLPLSATTHIKPVDLGFVLSRPFVLHQLANVVEALGYFLPGIYLPSYARSVLGAGPFPSALTVLLSNVASVFGCVAMGRLIDQLHVTTCLMLSTAGATLGTFLFWGFSVNLPVLYLFCIVYGLFAGSFTSTWPGIMRDIASGGGTRATAASREGSSGNSIDPGMVLAFLAAGRGIGNIASGPLSEVLVRDRPWQGQAAAGYGSGYGSLIIFTGVTATVGGTTFLWRRLGWL